MYGRLNRAYGWAWEYEDGSLGPFILHEVERYAGMISGFTTDGRKCTRPQSEFDGLSHDGRTWFPVGELLSQMPTEAPHVRIDDVPLPPPRD